MRTKLIKYVIFFAGLFIGTVILAGGLFLVRVDDTPYVWYLRVIWEVIGLFMAVIFSIFVPTVVWFELFAEPSER